MPANLPYEEDFFQRVVNVNWAGGDVIVVFVDNVVIAAQPSSTYTVLKDKVTFLKSWRTPYQASGFQPGFNTVAYRVPPSTGEFMRSTTPNTAEEDIDYGCWQTCAVFALDSGNVEGSVARAEAGVRQIIPCTYVLFNHADSDLPTVMCPPGLLWLVETVHAPSGTSFTWKIRRDKHRHDSNDVPPNVMAQCYPVGSGYSSSAPDNVSVSGYRIYGYRLDKKGTGRVYGEQQLDDISHHNIASEWNVPIAGSDRGIPFQDPPPLIGADI